MLFIPYPCFLSEFFLIEMKFPPIILGGTAHEFTHLISVVSCFLLTTSSIYFSLFSSHRFAASYAFDNILPNKATISVAAMSSIVHGRISTTNSIFSV